MKTHNCIKQKRNGLDVDCEKTYKMNIVFVREGGYIILVDEWLKRINHRRCRILGVEKDRMKALMALGL